VAFLTALDLLGTLLRMVTQQAVRKVREKRNGEGSLYQSGGYWIYQIGYTADGKHLKFKKRVGRLGDVEHSAAWKSAKQVRDEFFHSLKSSTLNLSRVSCSVLIDQYLTWLDVHRPKSAKDMRYQLEGAMKAFFGPMKAQSLTSANIESYQRKRTNAGKANATINRELAGLRAALRFEARRKPSRISLSEIPFWHALPESKPREGFLDFDGYDKLLEALPLSLRIPFVIGYHGGMRLSEVLNIKWTDIDFESGFVRLDDSRSGKPRSLPFYHHLGPVLEGHRAYRDAHCPDAKYVCFWRAEDVLIGHGGRRNATGDRIKSFYESWRESVTRAGFPGLLFHDLRRSAVRNMVTIMKIPESQAMLISGHETNAMLTRYNIILPQDLLNTGKEMDQFMKDRTKKKAAGRKVGSN
jgi:integrase